MDTSNPVLSGLVRKRQEIETELDTAQARVRQLVMDIDALDATIRLFAPDIDLATIKVRPTPRRHEAHRGDTSRLILNLLRDTAEPLTHREVTIRIMMARGLNLADKPLYQTIRARVGASLRGLRERRQLVSDAGRGEGVRWWVAQ